MEAPRKPRKSRRAPNKIDLDHDRVKQLLDKGLNQKEIAATQGVSRWTIARFVEECKEDFQAVDTFKEHRAEIFARLGAKNLNLQHKLIDRLCNDGILEALTPTQISSLIFALNSQHGTIYDKERIERGQSTQNVSLMHKIIDGSVNNLYKSTGSRQVVVPTGDHNQESTSVEPPSEPVAPDFDGQKEDRQGGL